MAEVILVDSGDRKSAIDAIFDRIGVEQFKGMHVAIKANFNSADPFPASTHEETLAGVISGLKDGGARDIVLAERSGMGVTREVLEERGIFRMSRALGFRVVVIDDTGPDGFAGIPPDGLHWKRGFLIARVFTDADRVVQTCCLKTHRFGGHFTLSLKNSVGCIARYDPAGGYDYMHELHSSPHQRLMIAEINKFYHTDLVIMDATQAFVKGGPDTGDLVRPGLMIAGNDRVAVDAAGVSLLRSYGSTKEVMKGPVFSLEQIARAAELGAGVSTPSGIDLVPLDKKSKAAAERIREYLDAG
ncbi:MAG: DUF362 domain-containing protein [Methanoregulaceae archaeon]|nr:DUF362 domain-containing protein [Methanoregulaceae archaeon]